jgi:oligopeptide/dipeptide ABC transporter ATP-binding protein
MPQPLLAIRNLHLMMTSYEGAAHILDGIELTLERGQIRGLVGETGCGKSLTGRSVARLVPSPPAQYPRGQILLDGRDLLRLPEAEMRKLRGRRIGMIFQDPTTNLNPAFRIGEQMADVALAAARSDPSLLGLDQGAGEKARRKAARALAVELLGKVGIHDPQERIDDYPHQFSGGMRQRVLIAMALIGRPDVLIADEPTTALDVSVQAQILILIRRLVAEFDLGVLLITHNLGVVAQACTHVSVMYAGSIVEEGPVAAIFRDPRHPYTKALLAAVPRAGLARGKLTGLAGTVPNLINPPAGCRFAPRCSHARPACRSAAPPAVVVGQGRVVRCVLAAPAPADASDRAGR